MMARTTVITARRVICFPVLVFVLLVPGPPMPGPLPVFAATGVERPLEDPALEARARGLFRELRCMVCEGQSLDESDAPLARDLRQVIREQMREGKSEQDILAFATARYGDFIRLRPPLDGRTLLLWGMPGIILLAGLAGLVIRWRKRLAKQSAATPKNM